jgi:hypothetical protein
MEAQMLRRKGSTEMLVHEILHAQHITRGHLERMYGTGKGERGSVVG